MNDTHNLIIVCYNVDSVLFYFFLYFVYQNRKTYVFILCLRLSWTCPCGFFSGIFNVYKICMFMYISYKLNL